MSGICVHLTKILLIDQSLCEINMLSVFVTIDYFVVRIAVCCYIINENSFYVGKLPPLHAENILLKL